MKQETKNTRIQIVLDYELLKIGIEHTLSSIPNVSTIASELKETAIFHDAKIFKPHIFITSPSLPFYNPYKLAKQLHESADISTLFIGQNHISDNDVQNAVQHSVLGILTSQCKRDDLIEAIQSLTLKQPHFSVCALTAQDYSEHSRAPTRRQRLTSREVDVLRYLGTGMRPAGIADQLGIAVKTVSRHKANIMTKLGLYSQVQLALYAVREGVSPL